MKNMTKKTTKTVLTSAIALSLAAQNTVPAYAIENDEQLDDNTIVHDQNVEEEKEVEEIAPSAEKLSEELKEASEELLNGEVNYEGETNVPTLEDEISNVGIDEMNTKVEEAENLVDNSNNLSEIKNAIDEAQSAIDDATAKVDQAEEDLESVNQQVANAEENVKTLENEISKIEEEINSLVENGKLDEASLDAYKTQLDELTNKFETAKNKLAAAEAAKNEAQNKVDSLQASKESAEQLYGTLEEAQNAADLANKKLEELSSKVESSNEANENVDEALANTKESYEAGKAAVSELLSSIEKASGAIKELTEAGVESTDIAIEILQNEIDLAINSLVLLGANDDTIEALEKIESTTADLNKVTDFYLDYLDTFESDKDKYDESKENLKNANSSYEDYKNADKDELYQEWYGNQKTVEELEAEKEEAYQAFIDSAKPLRTWTETVGTGEYEIIEVEKEMQICKGPFGSTSIKDACDWWEKSDGPTTVKETKEVEKTIEVEKSYTVNDLLNDMNDVAKKFGSDKEYKLEEIISTDGKMIDSEKACGFATSVIVKGLCETEVNKINSNISDELTSLADASLLEAYYAKNAELEAAKKRDEELGFAFGDNEETKNYFIETVYANELSSLETKLNESKDAYKEAAKKYAISYATHTVVTATNEISEKINNASGELKEEIEDIKDASSNKVEIKIEENTELRKQLEESIKKMDDEYQNVLDSYNAFANATSGLENAVLDNLSDLKDLSEKEAIAFVAAKDLANNMASSVGGKMQSFTYKNGELVVTVKTENGVEQYSASQLNHVLTEAKVSADNAVSAFNAYTKASEELNVAVDVYNSKLEAFNKLDAQRSELERTIKALEDQIAANNTTVDSLTESKEIASSNKEKTEKNLADAKAELARIEEELVTANEALESAQETLDEVVEAYERKVNAIMNSRPIYSGSNSSSNSSSGSTVTPTTPEEGGEEIIDIDEENTAQSDFINPATGVISVLKYDLPDYSNEMLPVYGNSRVTGIKVNSDGTITITGYVFVQELGFAKPDTLWREIVFINTTDNSTEYAYRKQVTSVYNTFLNNNKNLNPDGTKDFSYANYEVTIDPNNMNQYKGNVTGQKMNAGSYQAFIRVSNGKDSKLIPLQSLTTSDGEKVELPNCFELAENGKDLIYIVK